MQKAWLSGESAGAVFETYEACRDNLRSDLNALDFVTMAAHEFAYSNMRFHNRCLLVVFLGNGDTPLNFVEENMVVNSPTGAIHFGL